MNRGDCIAEARRRGTLCVVPSRKAIDDVLVRLHFSDVVLIGRKLAKNRFGDVEVPLFKST
jgi:hypothetical protein